MVRQPRIGVYAGTFDPVHAGHIGFALAAAQAADLSEVYFLPERMPRSKPNAEHYGHRVAMLKRALRPHKTLALLELVDKHFTVQRTLPELRRTFPESRLVLLMGADVFAYLPQWAQVERLLTQCAFVVSVRNQQELTVAQQTMSVLRLPAASVKIIDSTRPEVSSSRIRHALQQNLSIQGLLPSVQRYAVQQWLYARIPRQ